VLDQAGELLDLTVVLARGSDRARLATDSPACLTDPAVSAEWIAAIVAAVAVATSVILDGIMYQVPSRAAPEVELDLPENGGAKPDPR